MKQRTARSVGLLSACALALGALMPATPAYATDTEGNQPTVDITYTLRPVDEQTGFPSEVSVGHTKYVPTATPLEYDGYIDDASLREGVKKVDVTETIVNGQAVVQSSITFPSGDLPAGDYEWEIDSDEYIDCEDSGFIVFSDSSYFLVSASFTEDKEWTNIKVTEKRLNDDSFAEVVTKIDMSGVLIRGGNLRILPPASAKEGDTFKVHFAANFAPAFKTLAEDMSQEMGSAMVAELFLLSEGMCDVGTAKLGGVSFPRLEELDEPSYIRWLDDLFEEDLVITDEGIPMLPASLYDMTFECDITVDGSDSDGVIVADLSDEDNDVARLASFVFAAGSKFSVTPVVSEGSPLFRVESYGYSSVNGEVHNPTGVDQVMMNERNVIQLEYSEDVPIYRLYSKASGEHLYVNNDVERDALVARGWKYEGVAFYTPKTSSTEVHRLYHPVTGDHHYTSDPVEIAGLTEKHGWKDEGVLFYGDDLKRVPLTRLHKPGLAVGGHLHSADPKEIEALTTKHGWKEEGISFYVVKYGG